MSYLALCFDIFLINKLSMQKRHSYLIFYVQRKNMSSYWISQRPMCGTWRKQPIMVGRQWEEMGQTRQRYDTCVNEAKKPRLRKMFLSSKGFYGYTKCFSLLQCKMQWKRRQVWSYKIWCFLSFFLPGSSIHKFPKTCDTDKKSCLLSTGMYTVELSGNLRKHVEVMFVTICGPNIHLGFFAGSIIKRKSQPETMFFPSVFSLPLLVQQNGIFISDASSCVTITSTSFSVKTTSSLLTEPIKAADFQTENTKAFCMYAFQSFIVNQNFRFDL